MATTQKPDPADLTTSPAPGPAADVPASTAGLKGRTDATSSGDVAELRGADLLKAAQAKAPSLTAEFVKTFDLDDEELREIARGAVPPPPTIGPLHTADLHLTPGGWQVTPVGVKPQDVGGTAISR